MTFQAVRAVFEVPVINALAALTPAVPCYVDNQLFTTPDAVEEYGTVDLQFGTTTSRTLTGNNEDLRGSLVVECFTAKNSGPARAQEIITPVMKALNGLNSCKGYAQFGAVGWVGDMTGPAFLALEDQPFYMVRLSVAVSARYEEFDLLSRLEALERTHDINGGHDSGNYPIVRLSTTSRPLPPDFEERLEKLEDHHDEEGAHDTGIYETRRRPGSSGKRKSKDFSQRLSVLELHHDAEKGHDSEHY